MFLQVQTYRNRSAMVFGDRMEWESGTIRDRCRGLPCEWGRCEWGWREKCSCVHDDGGDRPFYSAERRVCVVFVCEGMSRKISGKLAVKYSCRYVKKKKDDGDGGGGGWVKNIIGVIL